MLELIQGGRGTASERANVRALARLWTEEALMALVEVCTCCDDPRSVVAAATAILDRGWGKPKESLEVDVGQRPIRDLTDAELMAIVQNGEPP